MIPLHRFGRSPRTWALLALGLALVPSNSHADDPPKADAPKIAPEADAILHKMADHYSQHRSFRVDATRVMKVGALPITQSSTIAFEQPNRFAFRPQRSSKSVFEIVSDGQTLSVAGHGQKSYAQIPAPATMAALAEQQPQIGRLILLAIEGGNVLPNLMAPDPYVTLSKEIETAIYVGQEKYEGTPTHHLKLTTGAGRLDLWVDAEGPPLVRRTLFKPGKEENKQAPSVEISQSLKHWKFDIDEAALFTYRPPKQFKKVDSALAAVGAQRNQPNREEASREEPSREEAASPLIGKPAPPVRLAASGGGMFDLAEHRGQVVMLDFWATWCGPCIQELPILAEVAQEYREKGVVFYGINLREGEDKVAEFQREQGLRFPSFPIAHDSDGAVATAYGARAIPMTVLIDKRGVVRAVHVGFNPAIKAKLTAELDVLLAGRQLSPGAKPSSPSRESTNQAGQ